MSKRVLAIGAHPDDVEFMMAGTLLMLGEAGYEKHIFVVASGSCGSSVYNKEEIIKMRLDEAKEASYVLGAVLHEPVADDLEIIYSLPLLRKVASVIRKVQPDIILTHSLNEYMEDHSATCRLAVTAAFARGMRNFYTDPDLPVYSKDIAVYHCLPYGLCDAMGKLVVPDCFVDISDVIETKRLALACHESQRNWLDESQKLDSYLCTMVDMSNEVGRRSGSFRAAEGWCSHGHLGFCAHGSNPLKEALGDSYCALPD